MRVEVQVKA